MSRHPADQGTSRAALAIHDEGSAGTLPPVSGEGRWMPRFISLRYSLSYVKLFEISFRALEDAFPFDPDRPRAATVEPPLADVPAGYDVVVQRSRLLANPIPVIQRLSGFLVY